MPHRSPRFAMRLPVAARALRALAGSAAGRVRARRGSVLVFVLGIIALLALLAVLFAGIGRSDRQSSAALVRQDELRSVPEQVRDHIADVIARDALATFPTGGIQIDPSSPSAPQSAAAALQREAFDYPWTDPAMRSVPALDSLNPRFFGFDPAGDYREFLPLDEEVRQPSDPWLGVSEPSNLDLADDSVWGDVTSFGIADPAAGDFFYRRDLAQMSNFAPDGRAVNLWNLRGNFQIASGVDPNNNPGTSQSTISSGLTLYDENLDPGFELIDGSTASPNVPAHWFTSQRGAFRPLTDPARGWADEFFAPYQYADADGDGIVDSRWIELVDATDPANPVSLLETRDGMRYFVAIHAEDLSARVNVNTASDFTQEPGYAFDLNDPGMNPGDPADRFDSGIYYPGFSPADVSLFRMLRLEDAFASTGNVGYLGLEHPRFPGGGVDENSPGYYGTPDQISDPGAYSGVVREQVGQSAYEMAQFARLTGNVPPQNVVQTPGVNRLWNYAEQTYFANVPGSGYPYTILQALLPDFPQDWIFTAQGRGLAFLADAGASAGAAWGHAIGNDADAQLLAGAFGLDSLLELLTFNGVNDPTTLSPLEAALGGRFESGDPDDWTVRFDPLRSNRPLDAERGDRDGWEASGSGGNIGGETGAPNGRLDFDAMVHAFSDLRRRLTTHSSARPLASTPVRDRDALDGSELRRHIGDIRQVALEFGGPFEDASLLETPQLLYELYADSLAPYSGADGAWAGTGGPEYGTDTLFYGYRGPEFALRVSAAMTAHLADALDGDTVQGAYTVLLNETARTQLDGDNGRDLLGRTYPQAWWFDGGDGARNRRIGLDLNRRRVIDGTGQGEGEQGDNNRLANSTSSGTSGTPTSDWYNVYGFEPQPVLTEVATYTIITDANYADGGDKEWEDDAGGDPIGGGGATGTVTIDAEVREGNPDFIAQFAAFQVTNPWGRPISLGRYVGDPNEPEDRSNLYYLEFAGRYYPLSGAPLQKGADGVVTFSTSGGSPGVDEFLPREIVLAPGETKVFVIASETLDAIEDRIDNVSDTPSAGPIEKVGAFIEAQMAPDAEGDGPDVDDVVVIEAMYDGASPRRVIPFPIGEFHGMQDRDEVGFTNIFQPPAAMTDAEINQVRLWRVLRNAASDDVANHGDEAPSDTRATNLEDNDLLVDRIRTPGDENLDTTLRLPDNNANDPNLKGHDITNSTAGPEGTPSAEDNTGITLISWASVRRPDSGASGGTEPADSLHFPAYALEVRNGTSLNAISTGDFHGATNLAIGDLGLEMVEEWSEFFEDYAGDTPRVLAKLRQTPQRKDGNSITGYTSDSGKSFSDLEVEMIQNLRPDALRPADVLLPLGIAAMYEPGGATLDEQWTTLGESLALALGYDDATSSGDPYAGIGGFEDPDELTIGDLSGTVDRAPLERGHLVLDDFVPFLDGGGASSPPARYDGGVLAGGDDVRVGVGLPPAMALLEQVSTLAGNPGSIRQGVPGLVNVNTASQTALRAVPMLAPSLDQYADRSGGSLSDTWWWSAGGQHGDDADVATGLLAYRDKLPAAQLRVGPGFAGPATLDFSDDPGNGLYDDTPNGRALSTFISGVQEAPGFRSVGEILAARMLEPSRATGGSPAARANIDRLGYNSASSVSERGVTSARYDAVGGTVRHRLSGAGDATTIYADFDLDPDGGYASQHLVVIRSENPENVGQQRTIASFEPSERRLQLARALPEPMEPGDEFVILYQDSMAVLQRDDGIDGEFDERLIIANGALNSVSVRSDVFVVWFLLHGYRPEDVEGLDDDEPMLPSLARRYVMVVDRSNVVARGERPRILLFREVPL